MGGMDPGSSPGMTGRRAGYRSARAVLQRGHGGVFRGSWRGVAGLTVRKRTILVVVCGFGVVRYMFFIVMTSTHDLPVTAFGGSDAGEFAFCTELAYGSLDGTV